MQLVLPKIINYGCKTNELNSIEGEVDPDNYKSIKLMEKNGFVFYKRLENTEIYFVQNPNNKR